MPCSELRSAIRFNEAEALKPRMHDAGRPVLTKVTRFNEAEALKPRMHRVHQSGSPFFLLLQ